MFVIIIHTSIITHKRNEILQLTLLIQMPGFLFFARFL